MYPMKTYRNEGDAEQAMIRHNRELWRDTHVIVEGPKKGDWTVMTIREAIDTGFHYRWAS